MLPGHVELVPDWLKALPASKEGVGFFSRYLSS
jgi:hypothetical protein